MSHLWAHDDVPYIDPHESTEGGRLPGEHEWLGGIVKHDDGTVGLLCCWCPAVWWENDDEPT